MIAFLDHLGTAPYMLRFERSRTSAEYTVCAGDRCVPMPVSLRGARDRRGSSLSFNSPKCVSLQGGEYCRVPPAS